MFGQFAATSQFYLYGKKHCTQTGWQQHVKEYIKPDILEQPDVNLNGRTYMITGANAGIGKEISRYLAKKGASVYMVCRNAERANAAKEEIVTETKNENVHVLLCDVSLESEVRRMWSEFLIHVPEQRLDGLVCNAGLLSNDKKFTSENVEITFAVHLLFGTYLLGELALDVLKKTPDSRMIVVSSGGMYNTKFPAWEDATSTGLKKYDGQFAYAYAKRGQVLLMEKWTKLHPEVKFLAAHPGWVQTEAVDAAYGENKKYLEPLRTAWEGSEGIIYLLLEQQQKLQGGGFYLDRKPCVKHMAGMFGSEGTFTKNTDDEIDTMVYKLKQWSAAQTRPSLEEAKATAFPLQPTNKPVDIKGFMGDWFVLANIPTVFEVGARNGIEHYDWDEVNKRIQVTFTYKPANATANAQAFMHGYIKNSPTNTLWSMNPKLGVYLPLGLSYVIPFVAEDSSYVLVAVPDRSYLWIMSRKRPVVAGVAALPNVEYMSVEEREAVVAEATAIASKLGFATGKIQPVEWTE